MSARRRVVTQYEVDPLVFPRRGVTLEVMAAIEQPAVIRQSLDHLGLPIAAPHLRATPDPHEGVAAA